MDIGFTSIGQRSFDSTHQQLRRLPTIYYHYLSKYLHIIKHWFDSLVNNHVRSRSEMKEVFTLQSKTGTVLNCVA